MVFSSRPDLILVSGCSLVTGGVITDQNTDQARNVCLSYLWPTLDMMASLESVPVPASAVLLLPPPPTLGLTDWKSLKPRLRGLWEVSPSLDLENRGVSSR